MMGTLTDQLKTAGFSKNKIEQFDIFSLSDQVVVFPEERLKQRRTKHPKRFVIILQNNRDNIDPLIKIVTIAPLSTSSQFHRLDYLLTKKENQFLRNDSYVRIRHIQPVLKKDLSTKWGNVAEESIRGDIKDRIFLLYEL